MKSHRFLHGDCQGGIYKFRLHFGGNRDEQHALADSLMLGIGLVTSDKVVPLLNHLYDKEHGIEMLVVDGSLDFGPKDHPYGTYTVGYEIKTPAVVDAEELKTTIEYYLNRAVVSAAMAHCVVSEVVIVEIDMQDFANGGGRRRSGFFSRN